MATNTHTTATVKLRLDLGELITQLRTLADTLETSQQPKAEEGPTAAECKARWYINPNNPNGFTPEAVEALVDAEECTHEAWDVHPNGITRRCSDCRATLPDLEPGTCHCGAKPNEVHNPLFAHPERVTVSEVFTSLDGLARKVPGGPDDFPCCAPEPANYTDGTQPYRNPHTLDLPKGIDPAEAQHMLEVIADAQAGRTMPTTFGPRPHARPLGFEVGRSGDVLVDDVLRCPRCDDPWHPREICPACGCDNYRKNNPK